jgi:hypothetical protein
MALLAERHALLNAFTFLPLQKEYHQKKLVSSCDAM